MNQQKRKYKNRKTQIGNLCFDSEFEAKTYISLKQYEDIGLITNLELQPSYVLQESFRSKYYDGKAHKLVNGVIREIKYISDFKFERNGNTFVLDSKGFQDAKYQIKKKMLLKANPDILFLEVHTVKELRNLLQLLDELANTKVKEPKKKRNKEEILK